MTLYAAFCGMAFSQGPNPKIIAQIAISKNNKNKQGIVLSSPQDLATFFNMPEPDAKSFVEGLLKVPQINFDSQMLLVIQGGECRTGGFKVIFKSCEIKANQLQVHWQLQGPPPDAFVTQALTYPALIVLTEKYKGEVKFIQSMAQEKRTTP